MRLLSAGALAWLSLGALIIFFYLLKLKRKRRVVPSVLLWRRALEEMEANAPFRRLRRNLLLLLQLVALAALVFALARPLVATRALASGSTVIIIDATASMSARDEDGTSRLERAKQIARDMVDGLSRDDRAAIVESSSRVTVRAPVTSDRAALRSAIDDVRETDAAGDLADALLLAEQIARAERDASVVIISDGGGAPARTGPGAPADTPHGASAGVRFVRVGRRADNVGIVALNSRAIRGGSRQEMFASIANFSDQGRDVGLELRIEGKLVDARTVGVAANDRSAVIFDSLPEAGGLAELKLTAGDDLAADNLAYSLLPDTRRLRVGVAGENPFLLQALSVFPDVAARRLDPAAAAAADEFDCIVSEGPLSPDIARAGRPLLAINPPDVAGLWQAAGERERPEITSVDRSHPVNSYLSYADLHVESTTRREAAPWLRPIVTSGGDALVWAGEEQGRRVVMVGFDLARSDLPLKVEFPLLLANSITWLTGRDGVAAERTVRVGEPLTIRGAAAEATVTTPEGEVRQVSARESVAVFADTHRAGLYEVAGAQPFAASLLSEAESDTTPRDSVKTRAGEVGGQAETFESEREIWQWLALAALAVLAVEWWIYHRRIA
jgi:Ca-activated chloride channel family protein